MQSLEELVLIVIIKTFYNESDEYRLRFKNGIYEYELRLSYLISERTGCKRRCKCGLYGADHCCFRCHVFICESCTGMAHEDEMLYACNSCN